MVHNGRKAYAEAGAALARFRGQGGTVILVSNAPIPAEGVERVLEKTGVRHDAWDAIVSSGDIALDHIADRGYRRMHWVGPSERDYALYVRLPAPQVPLAEAEAIVCTGLRNDRTETVEDYRGLIEEGVALKVPFVCANPDLVVDVGARGSCAPGDRRRVRTARRGGVLGGQAAPVRLCHGARAGGGAAREQAGARAHPRRRRCRAYRPRLRARARGGWSADRRRHSQRCAACRGDIDPARLAALFAQPDAPPAVAAMTHLRW